MNASSSPGSSLRHIEISAPTGQGEINGMQFSLYVGELTPEQVKSIHSDLLAPEEWYYDLSSGTLNVSWSPVNAEDISGKVILNIPNVNTANERIEIESYDMLPEAYMDEGENTVVRHVHLKVLDEQETTMNGYHLYQNIPNPFSDGTVISFYLPQQEKVRLVIYDITGKQVFDYSTMAAAGHNDITVKASSLRQAGIYYYTLFTSNASFTRKMSFTND